MAELKTLGELMHDASDLVTQFGRHGKRCIVTFVAEDNKAQAIAPNDDHERNYYMLATVADTFADHAAGYLPESYITRMKT